MSLRPLALAAVGLLSISTAARAQTADYSSVVNKYCVSCHNERAKTAGLMLDNPARANIADPAATPDVWEKAIRKMRVGMMPPQGAPLAMVYYHGTKFPELEGKLLVGLHGYRPTGSRVPSSVSRRAAFSVASRRRIWRSGLSSAAFTVCQP